MPKLLCFLLLQLLLFSCQKSEKRYPQTLIEAERLSDNEPNEARLLLEQLEDSLQILTEEQRMYYNLLSLKTKDKLYIRHTSDSLIKNITTFYEKYGDRDKLLESYYYMGRVYRDLGDSPRALRFFQKALDISGNTRHYLLLSNIYSQIGTLYHYQGVYEEAIPFFEKAYQYTLLSGDSMTLALPIRDIARIYNQTAGKKDSAIILYRKAYELCSQVGNTKRASGILTELSAVYRELGRYEQALECARISVLDTLDRDMVPTYGALGRVFLKTSRLDSADFYLKKCLSSDDIYALIGAYKSLSDLEEACSNYPEAIRYIRLYQECQDSINKITSSNEIRKMNSLYNYQLREEENQKLNSENTKARILNYQLIIAGFILFIVTSLILYRMKKKKDRLEEQTRKLNKEKEAQYKESIRYIEENNRKFSEINSLLSAKKEQEDSLFQELLKVQKELLSVTSRRIELRHSERVLLESNLKSTPVYIKFHMACHDNTIKIAEQDWIDLRQEVDQAYNSMTNRLYELNPQLSLMEQRICLLIKISIKVSHMPLFLNRTKSTISSARNRLYTKLTGKEGSPEGLDSIISDL